MCIAIKTDFNNRFKQIMELLELTINNVHCCGTSLFQLFRVNAI